MEGPNTRRTDEIRFHWKGSILPVKLSGLAFGTANPNAIQSVLFVNRSEVLSSCITLIPLILNFSMHLPKSGIDSSDPNFIRNNTELFSFGQERACPVNRGQERDSCPHECIRYSGSDGGWSPYGQNNRAYDTVPAIFYRSIFKRAGVLDGSRLTGFRFAGP